jgi:hypothetical protein
MICCLEVGTARRYTVETTGDYRNNFLQRRTGGRCPPLNESLINEPLIYLYVAIILEGRLRASEVVHKHAGNFHRLAH